MGFNSRSSRNQSKITAWCHKSYILPSVFYLSFGRICNLIVLYLGFIIRIETFFT